MADSDPATYKILSTKAIWWSAAVIVLIAAGTTVWLLLAFGYQLDAIKTASTIVLGTGGAAALLLAARRQRSTEIALNQKDRDLYHQERDAIERRITDLYTKAADQLGSDKAPVRLAGMYALERVAQNNPDQRQTIVNVLCAYLRMPYQLPGDPPADDAEEKVQEREVRLTAQRLLADHLRPGYDPDDPLPTFWANITLDLTGATLIDFSLAGCTVHAARFRSATFTGDVDFRWTTFTGYTDFVQVTFAERAFFGIAMFSGMASFEAASFADEANFSGVRFTAPVSFNAVTFGGDTWFSFATFDGVAGFGKLPFAKDKAAVFKGHVYFGSANFNGPAFFDSTTFRGTADFGPTWGAGNGTTFNRAAHLAKAVFDGDADFGSATFAEGVPEELSEYWSPPAQGD